MALTLARLYDAYPDAASIEHLLEELFDEWYCRLGTRQVPLAFSKYLYFRLSAAKSQLAGWPDWDYECDPDLEQPWDECHQPGAWTPEHRLLNDLGLLPKRKIATRLRKSCPNAPNGAVLPGNGAGATSSVADPHLDSIGGENP